MPCLVSAEELREIWAQEILKLRVAYCAEIVLYGIMLCELAVEAIAWLGNIRMALIDDKLFDLCPSPRSLAFVEI